MATRIHVWVYSGGIGRFIGNNSNCMTTLTSEIEEILAMFSRLEEMCDDDSDQIVAMYRRNLRTTLTAQQSKHTAEMEKEFEKGIKYGRLQILEEMADESPNKDE